MPADGYLNFNTKIDTDGFKKGVKDVEASTKSFGGTLDKLSGKIAAVFSVAAVAAFGKATIESAARVKAAGSQFTQTFNDMADEAQAAISRVAGPADILETRLQGAATSIYAFAKTAKMETSTAMTFTEDVLQAAADSAAYYDRSIEETTETLKSFLKGNYANDAALGLSATETTRNAKAMEMYGKKFIDLSEAQKQLALLEMVKDANRLSGAMGQAAREADGWENVTGNLSEAWDKLLAAVGQPLLKLAVPVVQHMTGALTQMTTWANNAYSALAKVFGWQEAQTAEINASVDAQDALTESVEATAAAQEKALAGFDEIEVLASGTADSGGAGTSTGAGGTAGTIEETEAAVKSVDTEKINQLALAIQPLKTFLDELQASATIAAESTSFDNLNLSLSNLSMALGLLGADAGEGLHWIFNNVITPLGEWTIEDAAPTFIEMLAEAIEAFDAVYQLAKPGLDWIWSEWLAPVAEWTGGQAVQIMKDFTDTFEDLQKVVGGDMSIADMIKNMSDAEIVLLAIAAAITLVAAGLAVYNVAGAIAAVVTGAIASPVILVTAAIAALIAIIVLCVKYWDEIKAAAAGAWDVIVDKFNGAADWFNKKVIEPISEFFSKLWINIKTGFIKFINAIIDGINTMIDGFLKPINALIRGWNSTIGKAAGTIPAIKVDIPKIPLPRLASGTVIPPNREFLAVLGDQKHGTNIEAPLDTILEAFRAALAESRGSGVTEVVLEIDGREFGRAVVEQGERENRRVGTRLVVI
ncbi:MAG: hypothetical protein IJ428_05795 [Clostridia bacterium]|nr:hypothetical protein [Clostridia bacterium]